MKPRFSNTTIRAMTLIEVLVVVSIVLVLLVFFAIPVNRNRESKSIRCMSNLKEVGLGFLIWVSDHEEKFPWQISVTNKGTSELVAKGRASDHFLSISNYLTRPDVLVCPTDEARRATNSYVGFSDGNLSYFVNLGTLTNRPASPMLAGDRHLEAGGRPVKPGLFAWTSNMAVGWTRELHDRKGGPASGVLAFMDGHVEVRESLTDVFQFQGETNLLVIP